MFFYLVGIKGAALSSLAKILSSLGHIVNGVDVRDEFYTIGSKNGIKIEDFSNMSLKPSYYYIIGNAYLKHEVTKHIKENNYIYKSYPDFLNYFFKDKKLISISGTSGKTTSSKMLSMILDNTTALIGDGSYNVGSSNYFILESCEYNRTFLNYKPYISLILNVNYDHIDCYKTKREYEEAFITFSNSSQICVINGDEFSYRGNNVITYGKNKDNDVVFEYNEGRVSILRKIFKLPILGEKFAYDFVGVYLVAKLLDVKDYVIQKRMNFFQMPKRRLEKKQINKQIIITDYAHHPKEIETVLEALNEEYSNHYKICVFEPHTISRLNYFLNDYKKVLSKFDEAYLYSLFTSVREQRNLVLEDKIYAELGFGRYNEGLAKAFLAKENIIICFLGAGIIDSECRDYIKRLKELNTKK